MSHTPSSHMDAVRRIEFTEALHRLQGLLGQKVRVDLQFRTTFGGAAMEGRLTRVRTLPPDHAAVDILLDDRQSLLLDPIDTEVLLVDDASRRRRWLEFHLPSGVLARLERAAPGSRRY